MAAKKNKCLGWHILTSDSNFPNGKLSHNDHKKVPRDGKWLCKPYNAKIAFCSKGYHFSKRLIDAKKYRDICTPEHIICRVEVEDFKYSDDKGVARKRKILYRAKVKDISNFVKNRLVNKLERDFNFSYGVYHTLCRVDRQIYLTSCKISPRNQRFIENICIFLFKHNVMTLLNMMNTPAEKTLQKQIYYTYDALYEWNYAVYPRNNHPGFDELMDKIIKICSVPV